MPKREPLFKSIFGPSWAKLAPVFQKRYINRAFSDDLISVEGKMDIRFSNIMSFLIPFFRILRVLVPYSGKNIPVKVDFRSEINSNTVCLQRQFYFPNKKPYAFNSRMEISKNNEVIERMAFGMGWRTDYFYDGKKIVMQHKGYVWKLLGLNIPIPLEIFVGRGHAEEEVIDDNSYSVTMTMAHPWFGLMYHYSGHFSFTRLPE